MADGAHERIEHQFAGLQGGELQAALRQSHRERRWVEVAIGAALRDLVWQMPYIASAVEFTVAAEPCWLIGPDTGNADTRRGAVDRRAPFRRKTVDALENGIEEVVAVE
jgi:hypothetical protein